MNLYEYINGKKEYVGTMSFGDDYEGAMKHYKENKDKEEELGRCLEVKIHDR